MKAITHTEGIEYFRSEIESRVARELLASGEDLESITQTIRDNTHLELLQGPIKEKDRKSAVDAVLQEAARRSCGIARMTDRDVLEDSQEVSSVFYKSSFLENGKKPLEEVLVDMLEGKHEESDDKMYDVLMRKLFEAAVEKGSETIGATLFDYEVAFAREKAISEYVRQEDLTGEIKEDFKALATRIFHREWSSLFNANMIEILKGEKPPAHDDFNKAYWRAMKKAYVLMPGMCKNKAEFEAKIASGVKYEQSLICFNAMFTPGPYLKKKLEGVRLDEKLIIEEGGRITSFRDEVFKNRGDTTDVFKEADKSLKTIREVVLSGWLKTAYNCSEEHNNIAAERIYYSRLVALNPAAQIQRLEARIAVLEEEQKKHSPTIMPDNSQNTDTDAYVKLEEQINSTRQRLEALKAKKQPADKEFQATLDAAKKEIGILLGGAENPISGKGLDDIKRDYEMHANTLTAVWNEILPLYATITLVQEEGGIGVDTSQYGNWDNEEYIQVTEAIAKVKEKHICITEKVFNEIMKDVRQRLQKVHPKRDNNTDERHAHYESMKNSLGNARFAKAIEASQPTNMFDYLIKATFRYYRAGQITEEQARKTLERLRKEELARRFFSETLTDLNERCAEIEIKPKVKMKPSGRHLEEAYYTAIKKACVLMPEFASAIENKYQRDNDGWMTGEGKNQMMLDHEWGTYNHEEAVAKTGVSNWQLFIDKCADKIQWIKRLWAEIGDSKPSADDFYETHKYAVVEFAFGAKKHFAEKEGIKSTKELAGRLAHEETREGDKAKFRKNFRNQRLPQYMSTICRYKHWLEEYYLVGEGQVAREVVKTYFDPTWAEEHGLGWLRKKMPAVFFKVR